MRCVFAGTPDVAATVLARLLASSHDVAAVITRPDARSGRGRALQPSPVAALAEAAGIEVIKPTSLRDEDVLDRLRALDVEVAPIVAFGGLVPADALGIPAHGWVNLHFSLLPRWRGAAPVQHAIWRGDDVTGACTFRLEEGLDTGPVYGTVIEEIGPDDTSGSLLARLADAGADLLVETLDLIASGHAEPVPQVGESSYAPKLTTEDAQVLWQVPAFAVDRQVRACTPAPGAWTTIDGERLGIGPVVGTEGPDLAVLAPGELLVGKRDVLVGTLTDPVRLGQVRPPGKRDMSAADWARGARVESGTVLGPREGDDA
ncbi:MAG TPA: methionyl-tRNA formyltransferase [Actinobacteria bacterium]|nr:methionyl-tRNA formyltransferase [Actinomycetota bacterium]